METTDNTPRRKLRPLTAKQQYDILQKTFTQDPYAFTEAWEDGATFRAELEQFHRNMAPEEAAGDRRRLAMAAYYFGFQPGMFDYAYDNFEQFSSKANGGKVLDAFDDFDRVAATFQYQKPRQKPGFWSAIGNVAIADSAAKMEAVSAMAGREDAAKKYRQIGETARREADTGFSNFETQRIPAALKQDMTSLSGRVYNFFAALAKAYAMSAVSQARLELTSTAPGAEQLLRDPYEAGTLAADTVRGVYQNRLEGGRDTAEFVSENAALPDYWVFNSGSAANWFRNFGVAVIGSLPTTVTNLGMSALAGPASLGVFYGTDAYFNALDEGMSEEQALAYGAVIGVINGLGDIVTNKLIFGKNGGTPQGKDALIKELSRKWVSRFIRNGASAATLEGLEETAEQIAENITDVAFGRRGDIKKMSPRVFMGEMFRNVPEAFVQAATTGFTLEASNYRAKQSFNENMLRQYKNIDFVQATIADLQNRQNDLAPDEKYLLDTLMVLNDAADPAKIARAAEMISVHQYIRSLDKQQTNVPRVEETASPDDAGSVAVSEEAAADSEAAGQTLKLVRFLPHDPQDTANAVADTVSRLGYSADVVTQLTNWDADQIALIKAQLPAEILTIIENSTPEIQSAVLGKMYPAFYHNGKIFINAQSVRPSEVPRVLAHEAGLHFGLRAAFKANMDTLLDNIYADNFDNPELARIVKEYNLAEAEVDEEGKPLFDGEGNQIFKELSEENRRIAAEEFLADLAETGGYDYRKVYADNQADIDAFAKENNIDIHNLADRRQLVKDWAAATGYTVQKPNWFKRMISNIRIWFHNHGIMVKHFSDDDIANIIFRSAKAARDRRRTASRDGDGVRFLAEPFTEAQKRDILAMTPKNGVDVMKKILYGGSITRNGNTVHFDGKNSHALKLHLDAEGFKPSKGPVTPEEVERFLPLALAQTPKPSETKNKRNRKTKNKKYRISVDGIRYTLVTSWKGFFRSFYSNKRAPGEVNSQKAGSASSPEHINNISQNPENASSTDKNGPSAAPDGAMEGKRTGTDRSDKSDGNGALFTLNSNASEELKLQVKAMQDCVGPFLDQDGAEYARRFKEKYGITLDPDEAIVIAQLAISENRSARQKYVAAQNAVNAWAYFKSFNPLFDFIVGFAGEDFKINPGMAFAGDEFTGTFITPEYRKYSVKRRQKPNESDAAYRKYLAKRDKALAKVSGTQLDEVAQAYARESGRELKDVQEEIIDLLRNLQRTDIISQYKKYKDELLSEDDFMQQERYRIEDEVISILESGRPVVNPEFVKNNRAVYKELYKKMFGKEAPFSPGKKDIEAINAALVQEGANAATYAQAYKAARKVAWEEMQNKLAELKDKIFKGNQDAARLQREAATFAHKHLERENRGEFINGIVGLLKYPTAPTNKYPEGRRQHEFDRLLDKMRQRAKNIRRDHFISEIHKMLEQNRSRRTAKNVPYSPMGERQTALDRINLISRMNPETVLVLRSFAAEQVAALQDQLDGMMDSGDDVERAQEIARLQSELKKNENDLFYLEHYGNLDMKTPEAVQKSFDMLKKFIQSGREEFMTTMMERALRIRQTREKLRSEMTLGDLNVPDRRFLDLTRNYAKEFAVSSLSDTQLLREFSRISDDADFYRSEHGKILKMIEDSSELEQTLKREAQAKLDEFFKEKGLKSLVERGKFLRSLTKVQDTGIVIDVYGATRIAENQPKNVTPENLVKYSNFSAGRPVTSATFVLEHARKILEDINSDTAVNGIVRVGDLENAKKLYSELRKIENAPDTVSGKRYTVAITKNGLRVYADTNGNEVVAFDLAEPTPFLAELLKDKRQIFKLDDIAIASATARIHEYDAGVDIYQERDMGDDIDSAAMKAYFDSDGNDHSVRRIKIQSADPTALKQQKTLSVSPEQAVQIILTAEQPYYKTNMTFNGFTEEKISAIKEWLQKNHPGALEMGYALRDIVKKQNPQLDAAVFERYGVHLPEHENFWYADFKGSVRTQIQDAGFGNSAGGMTVSANFLTARRFHTLPIDIQSGFVSLFMRKQMETAHFIAWSKTVRELRSLYSSIDVQNVLIKEFGNDAWNVWKKRIELLATGGDPGKIYDNIANYFNEMFFPANIALNMKSVASQFAGGVAYSLYVPPHELLKRIAIDRNSAQYQKFISQVKISGYLANRANGGFDPAIRRMTDVFRKKNISPLSDALLEKSLALTTWSDQKGALFWGYMAYDYFLKHGMAKGMSKAEAEQYAFQMWKRATDETQQSGAMKDRNSFNINSGAMRAVTAYMTSPMQQLGLEISSIRKYIKDKTPENRNEMIRRIVVNHILVTTSMNFIASAFRHGINFADYLDDWEDYVAGWILGNFDAIWYLGKTIRGIVTGNFFDRQPRSLVPIVDNLSRDFSNIANDISGKSEVQWLDYLQATGDVLMSAGPAASRTIGMGLYVSSREIRRIMRWLEASKPKRKKSWF